MRFRPTGFGYNSRPVATLFSFTPVSFARSHGAQTAAKLSVHRSFGWLTATPSRPHRPSSDAASDSRERLCYFYVGRRCCLRCRTYPEGKTIEKPPRTSRLGSNFHTRHRGQPGAQCWGRGRDSKDLRISPGTRSSSSSKESSTSAFMRSRSGSMRTFAIIEKIRF